MVDRIRRNCHQHEETLLALKGNPIMNVLTTFIVMTYLAGAKPVAAAVVVVAAFVACVAYAVGAAAEFAFAVAAVAAASNLDRREKVMVMEVVAGAAGVDPQL